MLFYQNRQIIDIIDIKAHPHDPACVDVQCYLEDGALVWILAEWIDQTKKGELHQYLASHFPQHQPLVPGCPS